MVDDRRVLLKTELRKLKNKKFINFIHQLLNGEWLIYKDYHEYIKSSNKVYPEDKRKLSDGRNTLIYFIKKRPRRGKIISSNYLKEKRQNEKNRIKELKEQLDRLPNDNV